jgi:hypothetical protein
MKDRENVSQSNRFNPPHNPRFYTINEALPFGRMLE